MIMSSRISCTCGIPSNINLAELLPTAEGGKNIINPREWVLLNVQDWIDGLLEITTQSDISILLYHDHSYVLNYFPV
jgi:hypothetical protein